MRVRCTLLTFSLVAVVAAPAGAHVPHVVAPGETLSGIAVANGVSPAALAAANGLAPDAFVIAGTRIMLPPTGTGATSAGAGTSTAAPAPIVGYRVRLGDTLTDVAMRHGVSASALAAANGLDPNAGLIAGATLRLPGDGQAAAVQPASAGTTGRHLVVPGETLSGIAAANGISNAALAASNGLRPDSFVIAGTRLRIPAATGTAATPTSTPGGPAASSGRLSAAEISSIAAQNGVPGSLAAAVAWQESGFNNAMVSVANARGIMQVIPSTWDFVQSNLADTRLDPSSPVDNVRAGSLLLSHLIRQTGDESTAIAAYYQGLGSVRRIGLLPETQRYVANAQALRPRFGG